MTYLNPSGKYQTARDASTEMNRHLPAEFKTVNFPGLSAAVPAISPSEERGKEFCPWEIGGESGTDFPLHGWNSETFETRRIDEKVGWFQNPVSGSSGESRPAWFPVTWPCDFLPGFVLNGTLLGDLRKISMGTNSEGSFNGSCDYSRVFGLKTQRLRYQRQTGPHGLEA